MSSWILRFIGILMLLTALVLSLSRAPDRAVETLIARWAPPPSDFIEVKGQLVHVRDEGPQSDDTPLVLLHGTSASLHTWEGWAHTLKTQRRVISLDLPGFGLTGPFAGRYTPEDYRGDTYARFILDVLDALKVQRAVLVGNSLGGEIAWRVATLAPDRVDKLVLVDASGLAFTPDAVPVGFIAARLPLVRWISEYVLPRELVAQGLSSVYGDPSRISSELVDRYFELTLRDGNRRALSQRMQQLSMGKDAARLATITQPTLILWGSRDRLIPVRVAHDFERQIAGSRVVVLEGLGHVPQEEDPVRSLEPLQAFIGWK